MKILVTSGGTSEQIDQVRSINNHSTGLLGKIITETLLKAGHQVTLVTTKRALRPQEHPRLTIIEIKDTTDLLQNLKPLVESHAVLIHAMAVSDYKPLYMAGFEEVQKTSDWMQLLNKRNQEDKISSKEDIQVLFLKKNPKIISLVKKWNPNIFLIGFKLLVDVSKKELLEVATKSLLLNQADLIVANDLKEIATDQHVAYLVTKEGYQMATNKHEIAQLLAQIIQKR